MTNFFRTIKFGMIDLFGIAVPGFLLLFFSIVGFFLPIAIIILFTSNGEVKIIADLWRGNKLVFILMILVFSYVLGFILRLTSVNTLDQMSGEKINGKGNKKREGDDWPYTGKPNDKFPYFNFRNYLTKRGHTDLAKHVNWADDDDVGKQIEPNRKIESKETKSDKHIYFQRSKTHVNKMKLHVMLHCPELSVVLDANEAHVRLMSGTWMAIKSTWILVLLGFILSVFATVQSIWAWPLNINLTYFPQVKISYYALLLFLCLFLLCAMWWARKRIELLFHYRRVHELFSIVEAYTEAKNREKAVNSQNNQSHISDESVPGKSEGQKER